ncbi:MAG: hypothetical protein QG643_625 [Pseudomonadota bacterium]|nr:hypothetical protein [Pseudomonadota bacterium]
MNLSFPALSALSLAALSLGALASPPSLQGTARFLVLDAQDAPLVGTTVAGVCEANLGSFWNRETLVSRWSCTTDADGVCTAPITTLAQPDGKPAPCRGSEPSTIAEKGANPARSSYHAFFPKGVATSFTLLKKGASWKHGDYEFRTIANEQAFQSVAHRYRASHYAQHVQSSPAPDGKGTVWSTQGAHYQEGKDFPNLSYLTAQRDASNGPITVRVVSLLSYIDFTYHRYTSAVFEADGASRSVRLQPLSEKVVCNMRDLLERKCTHHEALELVLDPALAAQLAQAYQEGARTQWVLHLTSASGHERRVPIAHAEFAALMQAARR